jgi:hypothetical protein
VSRAQRSAAEAFPLETRKSSRAALQTRDRQKLRFVRSRISGAPLARATDMRRLRFCTGRTLALHRVRDTLRRVRPIWLAVEWPGKDFDHVDQIDALGVV